MTNDYWAERRVRAMGSTAHVIVGDAPPLVLDWAIAELGRLETAWSRFRSDSDLQRCNAAAGAWVPASSVLLDAMLKARALWAATGGASDPTTLAALEAAGYDRSFDAVEQEDERAPVVTPRVRGFGAVDIDEANGRVRIPRDGRVDLGGIGKGLAADRVARGLVDRGARSALVAVGGDLRACGEPPAGGWPVPVEDPFDETRTAFVYPLYAGGLVTSTTRIRAWTRGGRPMHHIVDPATGTSSASGVTAVVAAADDAWWAEGIAKAIIVHGATAGRELATRTGVHAWCFTDDGQVHEFGTEAGAAAA